MPAGLVLGAVPLAMPMTLAEDVPNDEAPNPRFPDASSVIACVNVMAAPAVPLGAVYQLWVPLFRKYRPAPKPLEVYFHPEL